MYKKYICQITLDGNFTNTIELEAQNKDICLRKILGDLSKEDIMDHPRKVIIEIDIISEEEQSEIAMNNGEVKYDRS